MSDTCNKAEGTSHEYCLLRSTAAAFTVLGLEVDFAEPKQAHAKLQHNVACFCVWTKSWATVRVVWLVK